MTEYGFYTAEELMELDDSDLSFEIADAAISHAPGADAYLDLLIAELQRRDRSETVHQTHQNRL